VVTPRHEATYCQIRDPLDTAVQAGRHRNVRIDRDSNSKTHG
jgi:hypothetical protein